MRASRGSVLAVLARILMLLACGPLLQPTGFCVCKARGFGGSCPAREAVEVQPPAPSAGKRSGCTCTECSPRGQSRNTTTPAVPDPPASPSPTNDHLPGCPASPGADSLKWVDPTPQLVTVLALPARFTLLTADPPRTVSRPASTPARSSSPPLYLSHCSLVI